MIQTSGLDNRTGPAASGGKHAGIRSRPGLRVVLLSLAAVILLLGATVAAISCYLTLGRG